ncbi:hypothetical protein FACS1894164_12750 [Spirochaetia bacterium]|nr:hypothetical protein FACS1894164_12750 [Spirochaetia bacterium]
MVKRTAILALMCSICISSCDVDVFGVFSASSGLEERLECSGEFNFINQNDLSLSTGEHYSFVVISDTHVMNKDANGLENIGTLLAAQGDAFIVVTGDITTNGDRENLALFMQIADSWNIPCYPVIGNHDIWFNNWQVWRELIGSTRYRFDTDNAAFFVLDTANGLFGDAQLDWLESELATTGKHTFVFTHDNLFTNGIPSFFDDRLTDRRECARFISLLANRADAVFSGHLHRPVITTIKNVQYITQEDFKTHRTYCRVYVNGNDISYEFNQI